MKSCNVECFDIVDGQNFPLIPEFQLCALTNSGLISRVIWSYSIVIKYRKPFDKVELCNVLDGLSRAFSFTSEKLMCYYRIIKNFYARVQNLTV